MIYYRVPAALDNKPIYKIKNGKKIHTGYYYIVNELLTENECKKYHFNMDLLTPVNIKKSNIYHFFGARFEK